MKIVIGCDHAATELKEAVKKHITELGHEITDVGTYTNESCHYPIYAHAACEKILSGECELGILVCGTGIGMSIAANKHDGIRAACCSDTFSARLTREHNDANVLCFGARVVGSEMAKMIVENWVDAEYQGGRHQTRVDMITDIEKRQK